MMRLASPSPTSWQATAGSVPDRTPVALYTSSQDSGAATRALSALRGFAVRQGWRVVHEAYDLAPPVSPPQHRVGWRTTRRLLATGTAVGLVVPSEHEIAEHLGDRTALRTWLLSIPAFAVFPDGRTGPHTPDEHPWHRSYALQPVSVRRAREDAQAHLTLQTWPGDIAAAVEVLARLAYNAVVHARPVDEADARMHVRVSMAEPDTLLLEVEDPQPGFRDSAAAIAGVKGNGLREARLLGAEVSWQPLADGRGKTVRARLAVDRTLV
ncbi:ATP-binding protein [Streptomyces sp. S.PB5]|uniref:ATP-binding protein n=1 Tax=Streptomyces sp. S.PB5 TaxID=3020844 RepID=UPI0025B1C088|nr:ATP-binding protein [Streptomyces sp. S.PB5]MDN3026026.1 ATP-binding protein [Streptomyces sp. S.PB5]